ncbi:GNAT family N-acetyltransferase [Clostridiaceae bacterium]|nr:GNAT family N-acetyltransferase [Clostridiaceae bacterium]RKI13621.1 GNAT family N-acetyltransferase [bacterium 1XD21-70]
MEHVKLKVIEDKEEKIQIIKQCDSVFPIRLLERPDSSEIMKKIINYACFYAAFVSEKDPVGYVAFYANDIKKKIAYISNIGVKLEYQHHHVGSLLMKKSLEVAKDRGMLMIRLEVLSTNEKAIAFYKHWGFDFELLEGIDTYYMSRYL